MKTKTAIVIGSSILVAFVAYYVYRQVMLLKNYTYKFVGFKVLNYSAASATVQASIAIGNESDLNVNITGYSIQIYINGTYVTTIQSSSVVSIPAKQSAVLPVIINFNPSQLLGNALNIISQALKSSLSIRMKGSISASVNGLSIKNIAVDDTEMLSF